MSKKIPGIPSTHSVQDDQVRRILDAMKEAIEVRDGQRGDPNERNVTLRELQAAMVTQPQSEQQVVYSAPSVSTGGAASIPYLVINRRSFSLTNNDLFTLLIGNVAKDTDVSVIFGGMTTPVVIGQTNYAGIALVSGYASDISRVEMSADFVVTVGATTFPSVHLDITGDYRADDPWITVSNTTLSLMSNDTWALIVGNLPPGEPVSMSVNGSAASQVGVANSYGMCLFTGTAQSLGLAAGSYSVVISVPGTAFPAFTLTLTGTVNLSDLTIAPFTVAVPAPAAITSVAPGYNYPGGKLSDALKAIVGELIKRNYANQIYINPFTVYSGSESFGYMGGDAQAAFQAIAQEILSLATGITENSISVAQVLTYNRLTGTYVEAFPGGSLRQALQAVADKIMSIEIRLANHGI